MASIHDGHRERMRYRLNHGGFYGMADHEVLEMLLFGAINRGNTNDIAHRLIDEFGSLQNVLEADYDSLVKVKGVGPSAATLITLIKPIADRYYLVEEDSKHIKSTDDSGKILLKYYKMNSTEQVVLLFLDEKCNLIKVQKLCEGGISNASFSIKSLVSEVVKSGASAFIISHNHPSGVALPSKQDVEATINIKICSENLGVPLLDHIIVADGDYVSMLESGKYRHIFCEKIGGVYRLD